MERMFQRMQTQEESLHYERLTHSGKMPIIGVNTFLSSKGSPTERPGEVIRATTEEKEQQIRTLPNLHKTYENSAEQALQTVKQAAVENRNIFEVLMEATKVCSLGQITSALCEAGGNYSSNM